MRYFLIIIFLAIFGSFFSLKLYADDTPTPTPADNSAQSQIQQQINDYQNKLVELGKAKNTLSNQIQIISSQIQLTLLKISQTQSQISQLAVDINDLTSKIGVLDTSLNQLSNLYIQQVSQNYKLQKRIPSLAIFFASSNFNHFLEEYKYLSVAQKNSQNTLVSMETVRVNYDQEKSLKETKQTEMETLKKKLSSQQTNLNTQKNSQAQLLEVTKNDEKRYQQLLANAIQQLNELQNFSKSNGGSCLTSPQGGGSNGWFFSQRDPRWCNQYIGLSKDTIGAVGCFISSVSMIFKKYGVNMDPSLYASNPGNFFSSTAWMLNPNAPPGLTYREVSGYQPNIIDNELKNDRPVIAQISMKNISGMHFIVLLSGSNGNYKIHDPWYGPDLDFSQYYNTSLIMSVRLFSK